jgi:hypothetical protein
MTQARRRSIRKRGKAALALGAAGVSLVMTGGASATAPTVATTTDPTQDNARQFFLGEEEISDVSLATFHVFDKENPPLGGGIKLARGGCGGCGGCGHGGGCGGCAHAAGCGGCAHVGGCAVGGRCAVGVGCAGRCTVGACAIGRCAGRCAVGRCACRGGCTCSGVFIGIGCLGCAACVGTCWQWDPVLAQWVSICY